MTRREKICQIPILASKLFLAGADDLSSCWGDDMGSFSLPLDLEPLPSLFNISPCGNATGNAAYKSEQSFQNQNPLLYRDNKQPTSDVADVLLSLKHAVVYPSPTEKCDSQPHVCHSQVLLSPSGYAGSSLYDQNYGLPQQPSIFPSMSVNVSMNMTMHGYHPNTGYSPPDLPTTHVQWTTNGQNAQQNAYQTQGMLNAPYNGTYSFTADFRPTPEPSGSAYKPASMPFASPLRKQGLNLIEDGQKPNVCRICGKSYARPSTLKTHLRTHSGEKPFRCVDCNKSFSQAANLTAHVRTHSGEKPFRCPVCDRRFSQSSSVTTHMRTHSGERPYRCRLCKKAFSDSSTLTKHLRIHSGEKPYECKLCLLRFSQSGNLNRHMRVHNATVSGLPP
ncbi:protein glass-like [Cylas formicarius]|uniref:protein glass-like n=1 Tax=Cylas formicarius TaxID=197179 RepID=UPI00295890F0|nr:protein glass-like [Cylas formicarius]